MTSLSIAPGARAERAAMLGIWALASLACVLGAAAPPSQGLHSGGAEQALDLLRIVATTALVVTVLLGPGIALRHSLSGRTGLAFLPLPGMALMVGTGGLAWALAGELDPEVTCLAVVAPTLGWLLGGLAWAGPGEILRRGERHCLLVVGSALGLAIGRALWSLGPEGELYGDTISRTLEVGDRSDSRISFILSGLVNGGEAPYGDVATTLFAPYNFSSRGPLPGLAGAPVVLLSGATPPGDFPEQPWAPFDGQGFMAYRLAMMALACTAFVSLWDLTRRLAGEGAARFALLLAATTPFLLHEVWFTWPKLLAASFVLLAGICVIEARPLRAGLLVGLGYLMHPVALLSAPPLALLALWPLRGAAWRRPHVKRLLLLAVGIGAFVLLWRLLNGDHFNQGGFLDYLNQAGFDMSPSPWDWASYRLESLAATLVPLALPLFAAGNASINVIGGTSPAVIHFFFQYWNTLPFGVGIAFFPILLLGLWHAGRLWPWPVTATVVLPFAMFAIYWGASSTGMLREGLQAWTLTLLVVVACQQARAGYPWLRSTPIRAVLALRPLEVLAVAVVPALATQEPSPLSDAFTLTDIVAITAMIAFALCLSAMVWRAPNGSRPAPMPAQGKR